MKRQFSKSWKASRQIRKQRKYLANAPKNVKRIIMSSNLSKEIRKKYSRRSFPLRKEDNVKVMSGEHKGKTGKVESFDMKKMKVTITGIQITRKEGTKIPVKFHPSKLQIQDLSLEDKKRLDSIKKIENKMEKK